MHMSMDYVKGLTYVITIHGAGDDAGKYYLEGFAIDLYFDILQ